MVIDPWISYHVASNNIIDSRTFYHLEGRTEAQRDGRAALNSLSVPASTLLAAPNAGWLGNHNVSWSNERLGDF